MKFNHQTILLFFIVELSVALLLSCQTEIDSNDTLLFINKEISKTTVIQKRVPLGIKYQWQSVYNPETSIINQIPTPKDFQRVQTNNNSFQQWLQYLPLFPPNQKVKTFDGSLKWNQRVHARVIDIDIGKGDLQQCADAVIRLRSEFLFSNKEFEKIHFNYTNGTEVSFDDWRKGRKPQVKDNRVTFFNSGKKDNTYSSFKKYLIQIFSYAGTASLEKEMKSISLEDMQIGDIFIKGGYPGHAIIIVDMIENTHGKKLYLLAQSYMPAQNIHILKNPMNKKLSPWYELVPNQDIYTPEWNFSVEDLKRFVE